jgi:cell wall assembly regulator SMI1
MTDDREARRSRIGQALERVKAWMNAHDAEVLVQNLAAGASTARLDAYQAKLDFPLPSDLRALWSIHAGQTSEQDGFVGAMDFLGPEAAAGENENVTMFIEFLREEPSTWDEAGVTKDEATSNAWLAVAGRGYADLLVVSGVTGRVFTCRKDSPPLHFVATSIVEWLEAYADRVEAGEYTVKEGFGACYLARRSAMF